MLSEDERESTRDKSVSKKKNQCVKSRGERQEHLWQENNDGVGGKLDKESWKKKSTEADLNKKTECREIFSKAESQIIKSKNRKRVHLNTMADIVQHIVVNGLPDVSDWSLHVGWCYDLMSPWRVFIRSQDPNLPPGYLLFMDVYRL